MSVHVLYVSCTCPVRVLYDVCTVSVRCSFVMSFTCPCMSVHVRTCPCDVCETKLPVSTMRHHHRAPAVPPPASTKTRSEAHIPLGLELEAPPLVWVTWRQLSHLRCLCISVRCPYMSVRCPYMSVHVRTCPYMSVHVRYDVPLMSL